MLKPLKIWLEKEHGIAWHKVKSKELRYFRFFLDWERKVIKLEVKLIPNKEPFFKLGFDVGGVEGEDITFVVMLPYLANIYLTTERFLPYKWLPRNGSRETSIAIHDGSLWLKNWYLDNGGWERGKRGYHVIPFMRWVKGDCTLVAKILDQGQAEVNLEGEPTYTLSIVVEQAEWHYQRWPTSYITRATIKCEPPFPIPGKGESNYDIHDDATESMTIEAYDLEEAVTGFMKSVLTTRYKRGGPDWKPTK